MENLNSFLLISSVYNEEDYLDHTIKSVLKQTVLPDLWIIVNDGSIDRTSDILHLYESVSWIKIVHKEKSESQFGENIVNNLNFGLKDIALDNYNFIIKIDGDLCFASDTYFEVLINNFLTNNKLGIASGITFYRLKGKKIIASHPEWRTTGALKSYRMACFKEIGGFIPIYGWDGIDDYKAMFRGWETRTFFNLEVEHLGKEKDLKRHNDLGIFTLKGVSYYRRGYSVIFAILRGIKFQLENGGFKGIAFLKGYFQSFMKNYPKVVSKEEQTFIRRFQRKRLFSSNSF